MIFTRLRLVLALPEVALPPPPLLVTVALPEVAFKLILLFIWALVLISAFILPRQVWQTLLWAPNIAEVAPTGAFTISPSQVPSTLIKTSSALLPIIWLPVRFMTLRLVEALPVVALPTPSLSDTVALPEAAFKFRLLLMD